jgi:hypothetical protein
MFFLSPGCLWDFATNHHEECGVGRFQQNGESPYQDWKEKFFSAEAEVR